ncbi:hypothetical protein [Yinghuangia sp. YIM S10712]|uniref:hypothetical protein n=1 Tax=Yinghuangia sp. YIM S10712 TaxID=3436930 RepID=UPI003F5294FD
MTTADDEQANREPARFWLNPGTPDKPACRRKAYCLLPAGHRGACALPVNRQ